jgi:hypothetical protein
MPSPLLLLEERAEYLPGGHHEGIVSRVIHSDINEPNIPAGLTVADHFIHSFMIVIQKHCLENFSRTEGAMVRRNLQVVEENGITQKAIMKLV